MPQRLMPNDDELNEHFELKPLDITGPGGGDWTIACAGNEPARPACP